ncbi:hypothetical protein NPIL_547811 [Nephila pilipes]|uniref:Uncharacterized protein n=1 Tax=Nephila pilipes TaxID=299642 RepID=A0A8X6PSX9_NEPPI|nr:hypothetical protein NPIL_547811 [Nephila pilipes]
MLILRSSVSREPEADLPRGRGLLPARTKGLPPEAQGGVHWRKSDHLSRAHSSSSGHTWEGRASTKVHPAMTSHHLPFPGRLFSVFPGIYTIGTVPPSSLPSEPSEGLRRFYNTIFPGWRKFSGKRKIKVTVGGGKGPLGRLLTLGKRGGGTWTGPLAACERPTGAQNIRRGKKLQGRQLVWLFPFESSLDARGLTRWWEPSPPHLLLRWPPGRGSREAWTGNGFWRRKYGKLPATRIWGRQMVGHPHTEPPSRKKVVTRGD